MRRPVRVNGTHRFAGSQIDFAGQQVSQGDALGHWAHQNAQVAAHAFVFFDFEMALTVFGGGDGLVRGVFAGNVTATALNARILVDDGFGDVVDAGAFAAALPQYLPVLQSGENVF